MTPPTSLRQNSFAYFLCTFLLLCQLLSPEVAEAATGYSIVLASAPGKDLKWQTRRSPLLNNYTFYAQLTNIKGAPWERLCLGYFDTRRQASRALKDIQGIYPGAWVQRTPKSNTRRISQPSKKSSRISSRKVRTINKSQLSEKQLSSLMQRARSDFKAKKYSSAIRYLSALISAGENQYSQEALELLGLSRQRKRQNAHAVATYEKYLKLYPDSDASDRVRQRLAGLLTASKGPRKKIRMVTADKDDETITYGSLSQFYRANRATTNDAGSLTTLSQLITFLDVTTLQRSTKFDHRYQFTSDHTYDFIDSSDNGEFRFIETYYEISYRKTGSSGRFGRQALRIGGILKRFDGASAGYQITPDMRINILGGYPVDVDNKSSINKDKIFYGATFETGTFLKHWDMNLFYFDQKFNGLRDRHSAGTEARYNDRTKSLFGMVDYDLFYKVVNILQLNANILLDHGRTAYVNAFMRKSPVLATSNALIGRQERSINDLRKVLNIEQIYQLARDRTANSQTVTVGGSQPLSKRFQATTDITISRVGDTVASGGVPATSGTGPDYFLSAQLVGNNLLIKRDTAVLGIRYYNTDPSNTISLIANSRFPVTRKWRVNPRLQYDIRKLTDGRSQKKLRAILRTDYRYQNKARFDFEIGYDETTEQINGQSLGNNNLFFTLGYRLDF